MVELILRKLGFKLSINEVERNLHDACKKRVYFTNSFTPFIHQGILQPHSHSVILLNTCHV